MAFYLRDFTFKAFVGDRKCFIQYSCIFIHSIIIQIYFRRKMCLYGILSCFRINDWAYIRKFTFRIIWIFLSIYIFCNNKFRITFQKLIPLQSEVCEREIQSKVQKAQTDDEEDDEEEEFEVNYREIFKNKNIVLNYIIIFLPCCGLLFLDPTMGIFYSETFGLNDLQIGLVFSVSTIVYMIFTPFGTRIMKLTNNYEMLLLIGAIMTGVSFFFLGPDELTGLPKSLYITLAADGVQGLATLFIYIPALPQLFKILCKMYPDENQEIMGDIASALYNTSYAVGEFIGPLLGGILCEYISFPRAASLFGLFVLIFSGIYMKYGEVLHYKPGELDVKIPPSPKHLPQGNIKARNSSLRGIYTAGNSISNQLKPKFYTPLVLGKQKRANFVVIRNHKKPKQGNNMKIEIQNVNKEFNMAYQMEDIKLDTEQDNNLLNTQNISKFIAYSDNDLRCPLKSNNILY
ncbi:major facilitator superfamily protein, putative [Ichthyophthirius multifiliis]|uniref:Major facilitator superfamily protein, putative n=1 Tax=Ichthyophthirius multifiliis TaxID=5932 RepID=G0R4T1_ICHMU|nr:major facilitator superfamily protein, putative [Ichthyophthirius multifiliis]EGR27519.1 major facilitator superfamily protein, putative [Ichthyophthirius multifiliis]|eukprot:XP_004024971.1 major facilitator superfamily protein, putative [Ichthyophthirius multifiliis]